MRKNTEAVLNAFAAGRKEGKAGAPIWTDGLTVYSYDTALMTRAHGATILNVETYSHTTTVHQNAMRAWATSPVPLVVEGLARGASRDDLLEAAKMMPTWMVGHLSRWCDSYLPLEEASDAFLRIEEWYNANPEEQDWAREAGWPRTWDRVQAEAAARDYAAHLEAQGEC